MKLFIVIVTYNGAPWIRLALDSLLASDTACNVVVVDNASADETVRIIKADYPAIHLIQQPKNTGFGDGNNVGISHALRAGAEFIFLLNQDAFVTPQALGQLVRFLEENADYGVATPLHCSPDLRSVDPQTQAAYLQPYAPNYLSDACIGQAKSHYDIRGINAAAWMVRASTFLRVGGFDPLFFMYGEDDDLITRLHHHGVRFALLPSSRIVHLRAKSARPKPRLSRHIWLLSERIRSGLLLDLKLPHGRLAGKLLRLLIDGIALPLVRLPVSRNWRESTASFLATGRLIVQIPRITRSRRLCEETGSHFLNASPMVGFPLSGNQSRPSVTHSPANADSHNPTLCDQP